MAAAIAPAVTKVSNFNLADMMEYQRKCLLEKDATLLGRMLNIRLGIDDRAAYFSGEAWQRVARSSKVMGLNIEWKREDAPVIRHAPDKQTVVIPGGIQHLPSVGIAIMKDLRAELHDEKIMGKSNLPFWQGKELERVPQRLSDFASGRIMGRDGSGFLVLQPVEQIAVLAYGVSMLLLLKGYSVDGRYPSLLVSPNGPEAYLVGGMLVFD